jgi:small-conductance mechanosensitive channel
MKEMNEQELETLIQEALQREQLLDEVNGRVMRTVRRSARKTKARNWVRMIAFAFGLPLVILLMGFTCYHLLSLGKTLPMMVSVAILAVSTLILSSKAISEFKMEV